VTGSLLTPVGGSLVPALADGDPATTTLGGNYQNPVYADSAADPTIVRAPNGTFYVYTTQRAKDGSGPNFPVLHSTNLVDWTYQGDAMPELPGWAIAGNQRDTWAPDATYRDGRYFLYFSARRKKNNKMAIGLATSSSPTGPFKSSGPPLVSGNSIDPFVFKSKAGSFLYWNVSRGAIKVQKLSSDGKNLVGPRESVLMPSEREYEGLVEGAWVIKRKGWFYLFYSGNHCCDENAHYATSVARSRHARRGFRRFGGNPIVEANDNFNAPGHNAVVKDDAGNLFMLYHGIDYGNDEYTRYLLLDRIRWNNGWPVINGGNGPTGDTEEAPQVSLTS
jgi:arabinan endo-1,5-alpha-L-arabinosidase